MDYFTVLDFIIRWLLFSFWFAVGWAIFRSIQRARLRRLEARLNEEFFRNIEEFKNDFE
jgi:hypothetical protein